MEPKLIYLSVLIILFVMIIVLQLKYGIVSDNSTSTVKKSYSYSRVQLAWWSLILLSSIIAIIFKTHNLP